MEKKNMESDTGNSLENLGDRVVMAEHRKYAST